MNTKYAQIAMIVATIFAGSTAVYAQALAAGAAKPVVIDAAVTDNRY
ncbi:hypothetical protein [Polynucleobacter necessarius]|nr:hypothetical protein [Polynucleobacter necessarius]